MKRNFMFGLALPLMFLIMSWSVNAQKKPVKMGKVCGNPQIKCRTGDIVFKEYELPFEIPKGNAVIVDSEPFYAIILKTVRLKADANCEESISENERLDIQSSFLDNKVFALKCLDAGDVYYTNVANDINFIAVYAGKNLTEANAFLKIVKATGKYKGANVRKMQAGINGT